jgi:hypothetical protein
MMACVALRARKRVCAYARCRYAIYAHVRSLLVCMYGCVGWLGGLVRYARTCRPASVRARSFLACLYTCQDAFRMVGAFTLCGTVLSVCPYGSARPRSCGSSIARHSIVMRGSSRSEKGEVRPAA